MKGTTLPILVQVLTSIYQLLKGTVLYVVLKSTYEKQAAKVCSRKVVVQTTPLWVVGIP